MVPILEAFLVSQLDFWGVNKVLLWFLYSGWVETLKYTQHSLTTLSSSLSHSLLSLDWFCPAYMQSVFGLAMDLSEFLYRLLTLCLADFNHINCTEVWSLPVQLSTTTVPFLNSCLLGYRHGNFFPDRKMRQLSGSPC